MILREFLYKFKVKQTTMAEQLGISDATMSAFVNSRSTPSLAMALAIEKLTSGQVTPYDWFEGGEV